ncbi:MAG: hypothetical protein J6K31_10555 [Parabacteroides sp.]|nr:hypothetical protein [Parabacteroides sp.]
MKQYKYILLTCLMTGFFACEEDTAPEMMAPALSLEAPSDRGRSFITLNGYISELSQVKEAGFVLWETGTEGTELEFPQQEFSDNRIQSLVKNLKPGTTYSYYLYAQNGINRTTTEEQDFTTPKTSAALVGETQKDGTTFTATIEDDGGSSITTKGFCWSTTGKASIFDNTVLIEGSNSDITATIPELASAISYSVRAFAQNKEGYLAYGAEIRYVNEEFPLNIPNGPFKDYLLQNFDLNHDGAISNLEAENVTHIEIRTTNIQSLKGIEYFTNLQSLICTGNIEEGAWKEEGLLTDLDISNNRQLTHLECGNNQLTKLNLSYNTALTYLNVSQNRLSQLDISNNLDLFWFNCSHNPIKSIDISKHTGLRYLYIHGTEMETIDVSQNRELELLCLQSCKFKQVDVHQNLKLQELMCDGNELTNLDLSQNAMLNTLQCAYNNLTSLDISNQSGLVYLDCLNNPLQTIWVWNGFNKANDANFKKPANATYRVK